MVMGHTAIFRSKEGGFTRPWKDMKKETYTSVATISSRVPGNMSMTGISGIV